MSEGILKDVVKITKRSKGNASWTVITTSKDGKEKEEHLIVKGDRSAQAALEGKFSGGVGQYRLHYKEDGKYWHLVDADPVREGSSSPAPGSGGEVRGSGTGNDNTGHTPARLSVALRASEDTARIISALIQVGFYKEANIDSVCNDYFLVLDAVFNRIKKHLENKPVPTGPTEGA